MKITCRVVQAALVLLAAVLPYKPVFAQTNCAPPPSGLVGWWAAEGDAADNLSANNGVLQGQVAFQTGEVGQAFSLNGTDANIRVPASSSLNVGLGNGMTIEAWIKPAEVNSSRPIVEWNNGSFGVLLDIAVPTSVGGAGPGSFTGYFKDTGLAGHPVNSPPGALNTNSFQHVAVTYDRASGTAVAFLNGVAVGFANVGQFTPMTLGDLYLGFRPYDAGAGTRFAGLMDEVSLYNRALSTNEIQAIYAAGAAGKCGMAPGIMVQPANQAVVVGGSVSFTVNASGSRPLAYQWLFNGTNIVEGTTASLTLTNVQYAQSGNYAVVVTNASGSVTSSNAVLTVNSKPIITQQPQGQTAVAGSTVTFSVNAIGTPILRYQWRLNGINISGATSNTLVRTNVQSSSAGTYTVYISNTYGSATSSNAVLTLITPPAIATQPKNQTGIVGGTASFGVSATGTAPLSYQWCKDAAPISGATTTSLALTNVQFGDAGLYSVIVTNLVGMATSAAATLTVIPPPSQTNIAGFGGNLAVNWTLNGVSTATNDVLQITDGKSNESGSAFYNTPQIISQFTASFVYQSRHIGGGEAGDGMVFVLQNQGPTALGGGYGYSAGSGHQAITNASGVIFNLYAGLGTGRGTGYAPVALSNLVFQSTTPVDLLDPVQVTLAYDGTNLTETLVDLVTAGYFVTSYAVDLQGAVRGSTAYVGFSGSCGAAAQLQQITNFQFQSVFVPVPPVIVTQPSSQAAAVGANVTFSVAAGGTPPLSYQWQLNSTNVPGATNSSLVLTNVQLTDAGSYSVTVSNTAGATTSSNALLTVAEPPVIVAQPQGQTVIAGTNVTFSVGVNSTLPLSYQWQLNNANISGATASSLVLSNVQPANAGSYSVVVSNAVGTITSSNALLAVFVPPAIATQPQSQTAYVGGAVALSVTATGTAPNYQWWKDGIIIPGATGTSLLLANLQLADAGAYSVIASNLAGVAISSNAVLTVLPPPPCVAAPAGLAAWWRGEGNSLDSLGGNNGTAYNGVSYGGGEVGQAFVLDGIAGHIRVPDSPSLRFTNALTLEAWINPSRIAGQCIITKWDMLWGFNQKSYSFYLNTDGRLYLALSPSGSDISKVVVISSNPVPAGIWTHVAGTYDGTAVRVYLNGALQGSADWNLPIYQGTNDLAIGANVGGASLGQADGLFAGMIDEPTIYGHALSASEIQAVYSAGPSGKCALPLAIATQPQSQAAAVGATVTFSVTAAGTPPFTYQWLFNNNNITGATGSSLVLTNVQLVDAGAYSVFVSNAVGAVTSSNAVLTVMPPPPCAPVPSGLVGWWRGEGNAMDQSGINDGSLEDSLGFANGEVAQAFYFNGTSGDVRVPASASLNVGLGDGMTIEAWIKPADVNSSRPIVEWNNGSFGVLLDIAVPTSVGGAGPGSFTGYFKDTGLAGHPVNSPPGALNTNSFQHVAVTYDKASGTAVAFLNGVAVGFANVGQFTPMTSGDLYLGFRPYDAGAGTRFAGLMDEVSLYNRALSTNEIQAIYAAGASGKCAAPAAPFIIAQPQNQTAMVGTTVSFAVTAGGTRPLSYQWQLNSNNIAGATSSSLALTNVQFANAGAYSVIVSNVAGVVTSATADLVVQFPAAKVQVVGASATGGSTVTVPIILVANGNENALAFTLNFDPAMLTYSGVTLGSGATGATLVPNASQAASGWVGLGVALSSGATFPAGTQEVALVTFTAAVSTNNTSSTIGFGSQVATAELSDSHANKLPANFVAGTVAISATDFEGDVSPWPGGDKAVTVTDWVLVGRFAAHLDEPANTNQFQRADCAPRNTLGNGAITITDWVQAGRYMAKLDPLTPAAGPSAPTSGASPKLVRRDPPSGPTPNDSSRQVQALNTVLVQGQPGTLLVILQAQGDENALGFSLSFDPTVLTYTGASLASAPAGTLFNNNDTQAAAGRLGFTLALAPGSTFAAGSQQLVKVNLRAAATAAGSYPVMLLSQPVTCEVSDASAMALGAAYVNGTIVINPPPSLSISQSAQGMVLSWPLWATNFVLEEASGELSTATWNSLSVKPTAGTNANSVTLPASTTNKFYRLRMQ